VRFPWKRGGTRPKLTPIALAGLALLAMGAALDAEEIQDLPAGALGQPNVGAMPDSVVEAATKARNLPLPERMKAVSQPLLGRPYVLDPMGDGEGWDSDPLARYDAFDCLTFLEEVLSLSLAGDPTDAAEIRNTLRYGDGPIDYAHRHHFMELQWLPANQAAGLIRPTTAEYGEPVHLSKEVTADTWRAWSKRKLFHLADDQLPTGHMELDVLPIAQALQAVDRIRPGSIVLTVRTDRAGVPIWISHVGFTVPADVPTVRHATKVSGARTRDQTLSWYLQHLESYKNWPALGISLWEPIEQGPRIARLPTGP
jgi:hypothetical protein